MLTQRLIAAAVGIPVIIAVILIGGILYTAVAVIILSLATLEFVALTDGSGRRNPWHADLPAVAAVAAVALITLGADSGFDDWTGAIVAGAGIAFIAALIGSGENGLPRWLAMVSSVLYIGVLGSYLVLLRGLPDGEDWVFLAVLATWGVDTAAYFGGKALGRHKMAPRISPGKTWEGTAAALVAGPLIVLLLDAVLSLPIETFEALLLGLLLPPVAVVADLGESMIKRGAGVKDTSELIPGHGGFLDRMDSILFTVPLVYYFAIWVVF
jgi:phosphatidate cytidylyltransferase